ncbi:TPA: hypothetical protein R4M28_000273 [Campylobacter jejuni]|nr:hypothetical protein [Campylobacter coli]HED0832291.1 hypothetical protein [Campylobacter jejuni]
MPSDRVEIELFTGFYDKKGNKIYEGDILYSFEGCSEDEAFKYKVVFKEGAFYLVECGDDGEEWDEDLLSEFCLEELEFVFRDDELFLWVESLMRELKTKILCTNDELSKKACDILVFKLEKRRKNFNY